MAKTATRQGRARATAQRRVRVAQLFAAMCRERGAGGGRHQSTTLHGVQAEIARQLEVSTGVICRDMQALDLEWREDRVDFIEQEKQRALAELDRIATAAWTEWSRSTMAEQTLLQQVPGQGTVTTRYRKDHPERRLPGDPRFLAAVRDTIERKAKLLGLDAPAKFDLKVEDVDAAIERELARLATAGKTALP